MFVSLGIQLVSSFLSINVHFHMRSMRVHSCCRPDLSLLCEEFDNMVTILFLYWIWIECCISETLLTHLSMDIDNDQM